MIIFVFASLSCYQFTYGYTLASRPATIRSACHKCGIIAKSGEISCCGRSGSWFGNCESDRNAKVYPTWYEGIQACNMLSKFNAVMSRQSNAAEHRKSSDGHGKRTSKAIVAPANTFKSTYTITITPRTESIKVANVPISNATAMPVYVTRTMSIMTHTMTETVIAKDWASKGM